MCGSPGIGTCCRSPSRRLRQASDRSVPPQRRWFCLIVVTGALLARPHRVNEEAGEADVASLNLTCRPIPHGVQCQLLALSTDAKSPPRDVTARALWLLSGSAGRVSTPGMVESRG